MTISITRTIQIERSAAESYGFIADPETMPQWAIHNVKAIRNQAIVTTLKKLARRSG
jgi:hypothetical protein